MLSRRRFVGKAGAALLASGAFSPFVRAAAPKSMLAPERHRALMAALLKEDGRYDPFAKMLVAVWMGPSDPSTLKSGSDHGTLASLSYAAALLDVDENWRLERAKEILRVVVPMQDQDPESRTYGLWPWSLEKPLSRMPRAYSEQTDFCPLPLLMSWIHHQERLGAELSKNIQVAVVHAARSIQRRALDFHRVSIAAPEIGIMLLAAQGFQVADLRAAAKERLHRLHTYLTRHGSFAEYNSPGAMVIVLRELARMLWLVKDGRDKSLITDLNEVAWKHVATHFHAPTNQWAGPQSRNYETDLRMHPAVLAFLQLATQGKARLLSEDPLPLGLQNYRVPAECPRKWSKYFVNLEPRRQVIERFIPASATPGSGVPVVGTTWLHPRFTLGSVNRGDFADHRRPLLAYWGEASSPRFLQLRCLKDGLPFSSGLFFSAQHEGALLGVIAFAAESAESRTGLDGSSSDFRMRFEFGGELGRFTVAAAGEKEKYLVLQDKDVRFVLRPVLDAFGADRFQWDMPELKLAHSVDVVGYSGVEKSLHLSTMGEVFVCFTLEEWPYDVKIPPLIKVESVRKDGRLYSRWRPRDKTLDLQVPIRPGKLDEMNDAFRGQVV